MRDGCLVVCNWNHFLSGAGDGWEWSVNGQDAVFTEWRADGLGVDVLGQQELAVVFSVNALGVCFFLVLGVDLKLNCLSMVKWRLSSAQLTINLLSTVFTTISSGVYWLTSNLNFNTLLSPSSWINGELMSCTDDWGARERLLLLLEVVELQSYWKNIWN